MQIKYFKTARKTAQNISKIKFVFYMKLPMKINDLQGYDFFKIIISEMFSDFIYKFQEERIRLLQKQINSSEREEFCIFLWEVEIVFYDTNN